jgi:hypothetical protein
MSAFVGPGGDPAMFEGLSRRDASRLARYNSLTGQLAQGTLSPRAFERRVSAWRPVGGQQLTSDPAAVLARLDQLRAGDQELFRYRRSRAA